MTGLGLNAAPLGSIGSIAPSVAPPDAHLGSIGSIAPSVAPPDAHPEADNSGILNSSYSLARTAREGAVPRVKPAIANQYFNQTPESK